MYEAAEVLLVGWLELPEMEGLNETNFDFFELFSGKKAVSIVMPLSKTITFYIT